MIVKNNLLLFFMTRFCIIITFVTIITGCRSRCVTPTEAEPIAPQNVNPQTVSAAQASQPQTVAAKKQLKPDYFFAVAQYNTLYYGNTLENLAKIDVASAQLDISPDGRTIAYSSYSRPGYRVIKMIDIETQTNTLLDLPPRNAYMGSWNNDGKHIAINSQSTLYSQWQPVIYDIETGVLSDIEWLDTDNDYYNPVFSPNGRSLVFHDICRIYICDFKKGRASLKRVIDTEDLCADDNGGFSDYCKFQLSNDGKYLIFTMETDILEEDICPKITLCCYNIESGHIRRVTDRNHNVTDFAIDSSNEIYFITCNKEKQEFEGFVARIDGSDVVRSATFKEQAYAIAVAD